MKSIRRWCIVSWKSLSWGGGRAELRGGNLSVWILFGIPVATIPLSRIVSLTWTCRWWDVVPNHRITYRTPENALRTIGLSSPGDLRTLQRALEQKCHGVPSSSLLYPPWRFYLLPLAAFPLGFLALTYDLPAFPLFFFAPLATNPLLFNLLATGPRSAQ
jgi:hypothetical protein